MENIRLADVLDMMEKYNLRQIPEAEFEKRFNVCVYHYLPLEKKIKILSHLTTMAWMFEAEIPEFMASEVEKAKLFGLLFAYTNITMEQEEETVENYDKVMESGLYGYILKECGQDYARLEKMFDNYVSFSNLFSISSVLSALDPEKMKQEREAIGQIFDKLDKPTLDKLYALVGIADPSVIKLTQEIQNGAKEEFRKKEG